MSGSRPVWRCAVLAGLGWVTVAAVALGAPAPLRLVLVFGFCALGPGLVATTFFVPRDGLERFVLALATSVSLATLVSEGLALGHVFTPLAALVVLAGLTSAGGLVQLGWGTHRASEAAGAPGGR